jgi:flagellin
MAFRILNNYEADLGLTYLSFNKRKLSQVEQQLSTGLRIVRAADDATDMFVADNMKHTYVGIQRGTLNAQYGLSAARIVDDALGKIYDLLVKIKDKIVEAANAHTDDERVQAQQQINEYVRNIAQILNQTEFDGKKILRGKAFEVQYGSHKDQYLIFNGSVVGSAGALVFSAKAGATASKTATLGFNNSQVTGYDTVSSKYSVDLGVKVISIQVTSKYSTLQKSLSQIELFMQGVDKLRGYFAGVENKLQNIIENNQILVDNMKEAESKVRNVDYASAFAEFQRLNVVTQANVAAIAQANQIPQLVLQLMR